MRILIVEYDSVLTDAINTALTRSGYAVDAVASGAVAERVLGDKIHALVILDTDLPDLNGLVLLRHLRRRKNNVPVIILTSHDALEQRIEGLDLGADDYLVKPVELRELEARIRALIRRDLAVRTPIVTYGPLSLDTIARQAWLHEQPLELTTREWSLLEFFLLHTGRVVSKAQLVETLCGWGREITQNAVEVYISRLRAKLEAEDVNIRTVRGVGYLLAADETEPGVSTRKLT